MKFTKGFAISVKKVQADSYNRFVQRKENMTYSFLCNTKYICLFNICSMTCQLDIFQSLNFIRPKTTDQTYYVAKNNKKPLGLWYLLCEKETCFNSSGETSTNVKNWYLSNILNYISILVVAILLLPCKSATLFHIRTRKIDLRLNVFIFQR